MIGKKANKPFEFDMCVCVCVFVYPARSIVVVHTTFRSVIISQ